MVRKAIKMLVQITSLAITWLLLFLLTTGYAQDQTVLPASPPVPVGSGARAAGMGNAFMAVADDATAASWNPGGLGQLQRPEISIVGGYFWRAEEYNSEENNNILDNKGSSDHSSFDLNYFSAAYAKNLWERNFFFSLNYQKLFDYTRAVNFNKTYLEVNHLYSARFQQEGSLFALSPALAVEVKEGLYVGGAYNIWDDAITKNSQWKGTLNSTLTGLSTNETLNVTKAVESFSDFHGRNFTFGFLWKVTPFLHFGGVYKSPFEASVVGKNVTEITDEGEKRPSESCEASYFIDFAAAYGLGVSFHLGNSWMIAGDITYTDWENFIIRDPNREVGPFAQYLPNGDLYVPKKNSTYTLRLGIEYTKIFENMAFPIRFGLSSDPEPSVGTAEGFLTLSCGCGLTMKRFSFDVAYQYRFGEGISGNELSIDRSTNCRGDVKEHFVLTSFITYF